MLIGQTHPNVFYHADKVGPEEVQGSSKDTCFPPVNMMNCICWCAQQR